MRMRTSIVLAAVLFALPALTASSSRPFAASRFEVVPLVSDQPGVAPNTDPDLVNAWGLAPAPGGLEWVSDNGTNKSTIYDRNTGEKQSLVINIPPGAPTGVVHVPLGTGFEITANGKSAPATFLFDTESGFIQGWNFDISPNNAVNAVDNDLGSVYKGLALDATDKLLFAADFVNNRVQVFDSRFKLIRSFTDPGLPARFAPFDVAWINGKLYVTFAEREKGGIDNVSGAGLGYVDVFDTKGSLLKHLVSQGALNAPWGMTIAPNGFGSFAGTLLVGNFGDGRIHAYDATTGEFIGTLRDNSGTPLHIDGLWALEAGPKSKVTFTAGPAEESHGLLGLIAPIGPAVAAR